MQRTAAAKAKTRNIIAERRRALTLLLRHMTQAEAAAQLGVSEATISQDLAALRAVAQQEAAGNMAAWIEQECAQLDADEGALRAQLYERGALRLQVYDRIMAIQDRRARWRGFEQAPKDTGRLADLDQALKELDLL